MVANKKVVFDVGLHKGEDTHYYLEKGFNVVAFEANPVLIQYCKKKFSRQIKQGQLTVVEGAVADENIMKDHSGTIPFYRNLDDTVWGTVCKDWADRNEHLGTQSEIIDVPVINFSDCLEQFGIPYYMKIDIEGMDLICLKSLRNFKQKPSYISIESEKVHFNKLLEEIELLKELGYDRFKAVQQSGISKQKEPKPTSEGYQTNYTFKQGASGLFGKDLPKNWKDYNQIINTYKKIFVLYDYFGDFGKWRRKILGRVFREVVSTLIQKPIPGWYDTHARHKSVK